MRTLIKTALLILSSTLLKISVCRLLKKISEARRAKNRSFGFAQDRLSGGVLSQYVAARRFRAPFDNAQGNRHMSLFQQPARN